MIDIGRELLLVHTKKRHNKLLNKDKKQLVFAPSSPILTNYFLPVNRALEVQENIVHIFVSRPTWVSLEFDAGLEVFLTSIRNMGLTPRTLGSTD
jgi:hypothetical protein